MVNGEPDTLLRKVNTLHRKLLFTMEKPDESGNLAFLDMNIKVNSCKEINCEWYKKPADTGVVLNFHSWAPIQHKKNIVEGTVHRVFRSTSIWQNFNEALKENENICLKNQYPEGWTSKINNNALQKIISKRQMKMKARRYN